MTKNETFEKASQRFTKHTHTARHHRRDSFLASNRERPRRHPSMTITAMKPRHISLGQRRRQQQRRRIMSSLLLITMLLLISASTVATAFTCLAHHLLHQQRHAFSATTKTSATKPASQRWWGIIPRTRKSGVQLHMAVNEDPFSILGLSSPTADAKEIKRAYKRMALKFHPDVVTNKDSTLLERKAAGERFAKINAAYELLSGKNQNNNGKGGYAGSSSSAGSSSTSSSAGGWTPPHRRSSGSSYSSSSSSGTSPPSTDWRDYIPNYNKEQDEMYDTGGDSFGKIFSDLFATAAAGAAGVAGSGGGVFRDFVEFLENNIDGYTSGTGSTSSGGDDDAELTFLLQAGTISEIRNEMDDTELVVQQLTTKLQNLKDDILLFTTDLAVSARFTEKMNLNEQLAETKARQKVVENYLSKARKRLIKLQTRYKQLLVNKNDGGSSGRDGGDNTGRRREERTTSQSSSSSPSGYSASSSSPYQPQSDRGSRTPSGSSTMNNDKDDESWEEESFGSFSRGRGSSRRQRASSRTTTTTTTGSTDQTSPSSSSSSSYSSPSSSSSSSSYRSGAGTSSTGTSSSSTRSTADSSRGRSSSSSSQDTLPPHRRTSSSYASSQEEDRRRLRELQVEDEFDKLKKELGL